MAGNPSHTAVITRHVVLSRRAPTATDLWQLQEAGVRTVLDLRLASEHGTGLPPEEEADAVRAHGMDYRAWPVTRDISGHELLNRFGEIIAHSAKPVLVHDTDGKRAGLLSAVHAAIETGVPGKEMLRMARSLDVLYGTREQKRRLAAYVDLHEVQTDPRERRKQAQRAQSFPMPLLPESYQRMAEEFKEDHSRRIEQDRDIVRADLVAHPPRNPVMTPSPRSGEGETPYRPRHGAAISEPAVHPAHPHAVHPTPAPRSTALLLSRRPGRWMRRPIPSLLTVAVAVSAATAAVWLLRRHPVPLLLALGFAAQRGLHAASSELRRRGRLPRLEQIRQEGEDEVSRLQREIDRLAAA